MLKEYIVKTINKENLTDLEMEQAMNLIMDGKVAPMQVASLLTALEAKGMTPQEIAAAATVMIKKSATVKTNVTDIIDIVGTGGDKLDLFNISTASSLVIAGAGLNIAKHGNHGVSSKCGSADVLESLGVNIRMSKDVATKMLESIGITFLYAPTYHSSMKNVAPIRRDIKIKTMFNILGPLTNPIRPTSYVIGAYSDEIAQTMINVYKELGVKRAVVFHGDSHMDEVSLTGPTKLYILENDVIKTMTIKPEDFGFNCCELEELIGGTPEENAKIIMDILTGQPSSKRDIVVLNSAVAMYCSGIVNNIEDGIQKACESIDSKKALNKLNEMIQISKESLL